MIDLADQIFSSRQTVVHWTLAVDLELHQDVNPSPTAFLSLCDLCCEAFEVTVISVVQEAAAVHLHCLGLVKAFLDAGLVLFAGFFGTRAT